MKKYSTDRSVMKLEWIMEIVHIMKLARLEARVQLKELSYSELLRLQP